MQADMKELSIKVVKDITSLLTGMGVTLKNFIKKPVTMQYPEEKIAMTERYRGAVCLIVDEKTGKHRCIACLSCVRICPNYSLSVEPAVDENKKRYPKKFDYELGQCMFCALCVDVCPTIALEMNKEYEMATYTRQGLKRSILS